MGADGRSARVRPDTTVIDGRRFALIPLPQEVASTRPLTDREWEVAQLVAWGKGDKEIADILAISAHTVRTHLKRSFDKLQVSCRAELVGVCAPFLAPSTRPVAAR